MRLRRSFAARVLRALLLAGVAAGLAACELWGNEPPQTVVIRVTSDDPAITARSAAILRQRFLRFTPHLNSRIESAQHGMELVFNFIHGAPQREAVEYLAATRGLFRLYAEGDPANPWVTDRDIVDAAPSTDGERFYLTLRATPEAGRRLFDLTRTAGNRTVVATWDAQTVSRARIAEPFASRFQISVPAGYPAKYMAAVLRYGALPVDVAGVEFRQPSP